MNKTRAIADSSELGMIRYHLYKHLIGHYLAAMEQGYYLEAITLMESLITDRLESALIYNEIIPADKAFLTLGSALNRIKSTGILSQDLYSKIDAWRISRNAALHEIAKIEEGSAPVFNERYIQQASVAKDGYQLFKDIKQELK